MKKTYDKPLALDEAALRAIFPTTQAHGNVLMVVIQTNTIVTLTIAVARDCGCNARYLPGPAVRRAAGFYPGRTKTDRRYAFIIADTARSIPHTLRTADRDGRDTIGAEVVRRIRRLITNDATRTKNRLRNMLTQIHPALERCIHREDSLAQAGSGPARPLLRASEAGQRRLRPSTQADAHLR